MSFEKPNPDSDLRSSSDRLKNILKSNPGSPISPFQFRTSGGFVSSSTTTSSRSSSCDSVSGESNIDLPRRLQAIKAGANFHCRSINFPTFGNIIPSGRIPESAIMNQPSRPGVLLSGTSSYGDGSIVPRNFSQKPSLELGPRAGDVLRERDAEEFRKQGNQYYTKGYFAEALKFYDKAIALSPSDPTLRFNRSAALICINRVSEAAQECENAIALDQEYVRAHHRLGSLLLRLGQLENARRHICFGVHNPNTKDLDTLNRLKQHLSECSGARRLGDWRKVLREMDAAAAAGADASPQFFACRAEAKFKLFELDDAVSMLLKIDAPPSPASSTIFGMHSDAYTFLVRSQIELGKGKFDDAVKNVEEAAQRDPRSAEISTSLKNVKLVARARSRGNSLFKSDRLTEACTAYSEGLRVNPTNSVLYCNRAACWYKLRKWETAIEDCNQALRINPGYTKALLRRAAAYFQMRRWRDAVNDYEVLARDFPCDNEIAASLYEAHEQLEKSETGEDVQKLKLQGLVSVTYLEQFKAAICSSGVSVIHFRTPSNVECEQMSPFFNTLRTNYPSLNFMEVDIDGALEIARAENVRVVPTFIIYRQGRRVKELLCPSQEMLESSVSDCCI